MQQEQKVIVKEKLGKKRVNGHSMWNNYSKLNRLLENKYKKPLRK